MLPRPESGAEHPVAHGDGPRRVLVVDDEPGIVRTLSTLLRMGGFEVESAENGRDAVRQLDRQRLDLIISDISMPRMGGVELLEVVRQRNPDLPVILLTGLPTMDTAIRAVELGAVKYLQKPIDTQEMLSTAEDAVAEYREQQQRRAALAQVTLTPPPVDTVALSRQLEDALASLQMAFQPLVDAHTVAVRGYEALMRPSREPLNNPPALLEAAERLGRQADVGQRVRRLAPAVTEHAPLDTLLFVNLHPSELQDPDLWHGEAPLTRIAKRVVLEITERRSLEEVKDVAEVVAQLRTLGFRIAVDDLGSGYSGLNNFAALQPEFVKLDMTLIRNIDSDRVRQKLVASLARACRELNITVVAEGVETVGERDAVVDLGADLLQGYLFGRPAPLTDDQFGSGK